MNIFGFRPFKGKFNLGNSDDIPENQDGTLIGSIKQIKSDLTKKYSFNTAVNILSADSVANAYEAPSDGIVFVRNTGPEAGNTYIYGVVGNTGVTLAVSIGGYLGCNVTIKKGTKVYAEFVGVTSTFRSAIFVPMV